MRPLTLAAVAGFALAAQPALGGSDVRALLRVTDKRPLTLVGARFTPERAVKIIVVVERTKFARKVVANSRGRFEVEFERLTFGKGCHPVVAITAVQGGRTRAVVRLPGLRCPPGADEPGEPGRR